ncbi:hypothetical protein PR048_013625 [Dryococelus australis]|uniref:Uncharacterized protein n=1 Tax=Dryococelus australis TaxID=614101 RepID=A0ABQ9HTI5_9NEOP|nr:hypothetical protein PR048_013625 [Dryococelus australis]
MLRRGRTPRGRMRGYGAEARRDDVAGEPGLNGADNNGPRRVLRRISLELHLRRQALLWTVKELCCHFLPTSLQLKVLALSKPVFGYAFVEYVAAPLVGRPLAGQVFAVGMDALSLQKRQNVTTLDWPLCSPDLNTIEHLWDLLKNQTLAQLEEALGEEWQYISQTSTRRMVRKANGVLIAACGHTTPLTASLCVLTQRVQHYTVYRAVFWECDGSVTQYGVSLQYAATGSESASQYNCKLWGLSNMMDLPADLPSRSRLVLLRPGFESGSAPIVGRWRVFLQPAIHNVLLQSRSCPVSMFEGVIRQAVRLRPNSNITVCRHMCLPNLPLSQPFKNYWHNKEQNSLSLAAHLDTDDSSTARFSVAKNCAGRCRWSDGFFEDLPFPPPFHLGTAPYSPRFTLIGSQEFDVKNRPNTSTFRCKKMRNRRKTLTKGPRIVIHPPENEVHILAPFIGNTGSQYGVRPTLGIDGNLNYRGHTFNQVAEGFLGNGGLFVADCRNEKMYLCGSV